MHTHHEGTYTSAGFAVAAMRAAADQMAIDESGLVTPRQSFWAWAQIQQWLGGAC